MERESGGAEERKLDVLDNGVNLLPLRGEQMLLGGRAVARVFLEEALAEDDGGDSALSPIPGRHSASRALSRDRLDRMVRSGSP